MLRNSKNTTPVYLQLVSYVRAGFLALDKDVQNEIKSFIESQQHKNGAFIDRAGKPDLYYSLFGLWLSLATEKHQELSALKGFALEKNEIEHNSLIEELALELIKTGLNSKKEKQSSISIVRTILKKGRTIDMSYQFFLIALVIDAGGKHKGMVYFFARIWLFFYKGHNNIPCSLVSALIFARKMVGLNSNKLHKKLDHYIFESGGFKAFESVNNADGLSTGVALFALKESNYDLRFIIPGCLNFVQNNYSGGAFLSGDGDETKDLEYTFYGLLALGNMVNEEER